MTKLPGALQPHDFLPHLMALEKPDRDVILRRDVIGDDWSTIAELSGHLEELSEDRTPGLRMEQAIQAVQEIHSQAWARLRQHMGIAATEQAAAPVQPVPSDDDLPDFSHSMRLVHRYQAGEQAALNELLARYQNRIQRIVRIKLGSRLREHVESMDIVQQVNMVAMRKLGELGLRDHSSILRWLSQIALNQIRDQNQYFNADRRNIDRVVPIDRGTESEDFGRAAREPADDEPSPIEHAANSELCARVDGAMTNLSDEYREIILRRDYLGDSWPKIAHELGYVAKQHGIADHEEQLERAVHAAQEFHRRAWIKLRRFLRPGWGM